MKRFFPFFLALAVLSGSAVAYAEDAAVETAGDAAAEPAIAPGNAGTAPETAGITGKPAKNVKKTAKKAKKSQKPAQKSKKTPKKAAKKAEKAADPAPVEATTAEKAVETVEEVAEEAATAPEETKNAEKPTEKAEKSAEKVEKQVSKPAKTPQGDSLKKKAGPFAADAALGPLASRASLAQLLHREGVLLDSYAALVGTKVITVGEVFSLCQPRLQRLAATTGGRAELARRAQEVFDTARDSLVADELILLAFADAGGTLPDRAIEDHISEVLQTRFGGDREQLFSALAAARLSMDDWRKRMTDQLAIQVMRQKEVTARVLVTPGDVRAAYEADKAKYAHPARVHIRMLSIPRGTTPEEVASSRLLARRIRERILSGVADFPRAARLLSHATGAGQNAGDAGWHDVDDLLPGISEAVQKLSIGEISPVLEVPPYLYLVQLEGREEASVDDFASVADEIESHLRARQGEKLEKAWLDTLKGKYFVQTYRHELF
jgi:parvulin-like peptidyl-prolyl isomerase